MQQTGVCCTDVANGHFFHVTAVFTLAYDLPHDFAGYGMLNILAGVLPK